MTLRLNLKSKIPSAQLDLNFAITKLNLTSQEPICQLEEKLRAIWNEANLNPQPSLYLAYHGHDLFLVLRDYTEINRLMSINTGMTYCYAAKKSSRETLKEGVTVYRVYQIHVDGCVNKDTHTSDGIFKSKLPEIRALLQK